jgi:hypothetical protein
LSNPDLLGALLNKARAWFALRTQPVPVMHFEADTEENLKEIQQTVEERVKTLSK